MWPLYLLSDAVFTVLVARCSALFRRSDICKCLIVWSDICTKRVWMERNNKRCLRTIKLDHRDEKESCVAKAGILSTRVELFPYENITETGNFCIPTLMQDRVFRLAELSHFVTETNLYGRRAMLSSIGNRLPFIWRKCMNSLSSLLQPLSTPHCS